MCGTGHGVPQSDAEAIKWYRRAADHGSARAPFFLGMLYGLKLDRTHNDDVEALKWYRKGADQGDAEAQWMLGFNYANGNGVKQDYAEATKWHRNAASQGNSGSQYPLGGMNA